MVEISAKVFSPTFSIEYKDVCLRSDAIFTIADMTLQMLRAIDEIITPDSRCIMDICITKLRYVNE